MISHVTADWRGKSENITDIIKNIKFCQADTADLKFHNLIKGLKASRQQF